MKADRVRHRALIRGALAVCVSTAFLSLVGASAVLGRPDSLVQDSLSGAVLGAGLGLATSVPFVWATRDKRLLVSCAVVFVPALVAAAPWAQHWNPEFAIPAWVLCVIAGLAWVRWCMPVRVDLDYPCCPRCGYPEATTSGVCSECGAPRPRSASRPILPKHVVGGVILLLPAISWIAFALTISPPNSQTTPEDLGAWIASSNKSRSRAGVVELRNRGAQGARQLLSYPDPRVRYLAMAALQLSGADANTEILAALADPDPEVRFRAAELLRGACQHHPENASQIEGLLQTESNREIAKLLAESLALLDPVRARELAKPKLVAVREGAPPAFARMLGRYGQAQTYRDRSVGFATTVDSDGRKESTSVISSTAFALNGGFRWVCTVTAGPVEIRECAVWTVDQRSWSEWTNVPGHGSGHTNGLSAVAALRVPQAGFDGVLAMIPRLLIPIATGYSQSVLTLPNLEVSGAELIGQTMCDVVTATAPPTGVESARITKLWIDAFGAIRRITIAYSSDPSKLSSASGIDPALIASLRRTDTVVRLDIEPEFDVSIPPADTEFTPPQP